MNKLLIIFFISVIMSSMTFSQHEFINDSSDTEFNILFIGNSLFYTNNLPELVKQIAKLKGIKINTKMIAFPNYAIADHWNKGQVQKLIASQSFEFVIIQQGPSSQDDGRKMLIEYGEKYGIICKKNGAKLCYFMVWPALNNYHTFEGVINNHKDATLINESILLPVGAVWKNYIDSTNSFDYYSSDGFHPSLKGSELAAKVIIEYLLHN